MRVISGVFILATVLLSAAQAHSVSGQNVLDQRLSLNVKDESLQQVLKKIQLLAKVNFTYKSVDVASPDKVTLSVRDRELKYILNSVLAPAGLEYAVANKNIVIRKKVHVTQDVDIRGKVTSDAGEALPGASVVVKGTSIGTTTDADGSFALRVPDDGVLVVSFIGFTVYEEAVGNKVYFEIKLASDISQLQDVVVIGYGSVKKSEVLGAVSSVSTREVSSRNYNTAAELLQGTVPGVTVMNNGGDPTSTADIKIRGIGSLNAERPLIILDGVIFEGQISMINPNEVEAISILKDAASAAIYGARASGGVILITTKKGRSSSHVEVNYQQGFQQVAKKLEALNAAERADAANMATDNAGQDRIPAFDAAGNPSSRITKTNWMDEIFQAGIINNLDVSIDGGNQKSNYFISGGYRRNQGILLNTESNRYTARINSSHEILKGVRIGENLSYSFWDGQTGNTSSAYTGAIMTALYYPANATVYREDGSGKFGGVPEEYANAYGDLINPVAYLKRLDNHNPTSTLLINPYLEVDVVKGLKFRSNWGMTQIRRDSKQFNVKVLETGKIFDFNELYQTSDNQDVLLTEQTLSYETTVKDDHNISALAGFTYQRNKYEYYSVKGTNFDNEDRAYRNLYNAKTIEVLGAGNPEEMIMSYLARANYNYKGKYLLTAVIRRDGTSKLISLNRWETYPSVSVGWNLVQESFLEDVNIISDLKLRGSWGVIGNLGALDRYPFAVGLGRTRAWLGEDPAIVYGYAETGLSNQDLKWESSVQQNIGLDFGLLDGQLTGSLDVFKKTNTDMLFKKTLPGAAGAPDGQWINAGEVVNRGFELGITYRKNQGELTYDITANISRVKSEIGSITDENRFQNIGPTVRTMPQANINLVGNAFGAFYGYRTAGVFNSNEEAANYLNANGTRYQPSAVGGDFKFVDKDGDGDIDNDDRFVLGNPFPDLTYSLNANLGYKGFDLNLFFQGVHGNSIFNSVRALGLNAGYGYNLITESKNAWTPENPDATIPRLSMTDPNNNWTRVSDFFIEDGSFLRLKNVTLGYTLKRALLDKVKLRLYVTAQNVFTITDYSGMDPEVGIGNYGIDTGMYPLSKVFLAGVNLKF
ncbi:TonB-dependent receptor [Fulvivirgaceae bacterium PWU5]|uniref:TonB-dependent receptor n=2 Tax=Dawidia cretensis TaxID=2782350 RepID=A0AAP2E1Q2_9BACT|nr:TonB-dependent receptor [Dawidia cretensis]